MGFRRSALFYQGFSGGSLVVLWWFISYTTMVPQWISDSPAEDQQPMVHSGTVKGFQRLANATPVVRWCYSSGSERWNLGSEMELWRLRGDITPASQCKYLLWFSDGISVVHQRWYTSDLLHGLCSHTKLGFRRALLAKILQKKTAGRTGVQNCKQILFKERRQSDQVSVKKGPKCTSIGK